MTAVVVAEAIELDRLGTRTNVAAEPIFWAYFHLGDLDEVFVWLRRGFENREYVLIGALRTSPLLDSIREDPRFADAMSRVEEIEAGSG